VNVDPSVLICVETTEGVGETLKLNAELNEVVEEDNASALFVKLLQEQPDSLIGEPVAESGECLLELVEVDVA